MPPLDVSSLPPLPAPFWFIQFFKVLGFVLHMIAMNLWLVGMALAVVLLRRPGPARRFAFRLGRQMPVIVAFGVNLGIVPLLFIQVGYPWAFYPATVLTAWFWISIIGLLIVAYYGVYAFAFGLRDESRPMASWRWFSGFIAAILFLVLGVLFSNGLSMMAAPERWKDVWLAQQVAGAATGTGYNLADSSLWHRWSMVLGMALMTTAVWAALDALFFDRQSSAEYRVWAARFAFWTGLIGSAIYGLAGTGYVFACWPKELFKYMWSDWRLVVTLATGLSPGLVILCLFSFRQRGLSTLGVLAAALAQLAVLGLNGVSRQVVQNFELASVVRPWAIPQKPDWGPMLLFLVTFALGVIVLAWMLKQVIDTERKTSPDIT